MEFLTPWDYGGLDLGSRSKNKLLFNLYDFNMQYFSLDINTAKCQSFHCDAVILHMLKKKHTHTLRNGHTYYTFIGVRGLTRNLFVKSYF